MFNTTMLRIQAETQPYVVTDFVDMDDGNTALFMSLLPNTTIPDPIFTIIVSTTTAPVPTGGEATSTVDMDDGSKYVPYHL